MTSPSSLPYRADLDGLRAIAILLVVLGHLGLIFRGGYLGVDVFFVLSGFLITSVIQKQLALGRFRLSDFWMRRVLRLFPALAAATLGTIALGWWLLPPEELQELGRSVMAQSLLSSNLFFWQLSGYFDGAASQKPLLHTWSLAVEEQFYLLFPLLLALPARRPLIALLALLSGVATLGFSARYPEASFYLLPFRAWELLAGAALALSGREVDPRWRGLASSLGLLGIVAGALLFHEGKVLWPGKLTLVPVLATLLLIASCRQPDTPVARWLAHPIMTGIGRLSYSWYLWHWPLIALWNFWKLERTPLGMRCLLFVLGLTLGWLSYRFLETPWRTPRPHWRPGRVLAGAALAHLALWGLGWGLTQHRGWPQRFPATTQALLDRGQPPWASYQVSLAQAEQGDFPVLGREGPVRLLVWGDSHAMALLPTLERLANEAGCRLMLATHSGAVPLLDYEAPDVCPLGQDMPAWNRGVVRALQNPAEPKRVLLAARWSYRPQPGLPQALAHTVSSLQQSGHQVALLAEVPVYPFDPRKAILRASLTGSAPPEGLSPVAYQAQNEALRAAVGPWRERGLQWLDPTPLFFAEGRSRAVLQGPGQSYYWDDNHLSPAGADLLAPLLEPLLQP